MPDSVSDPVERRLRRLEQQWRAVRATAVLGIVIAVAAATTGFGRQGSSSLRTGRLELTDSLGRVRATLGVGRDGAAWTLMDSTGRTVAALTLEESGQIAVRDAEGRVQAMLGAATAHRLTDR
jgi:hypothetical protein